MTPIIIYSATHYIANKHNLSTASMTCLQAVWILIIILLFYSVTKLINEYYTVSDGYTILNSFQLNILFKKYKKFYDAKLYG